MSRPIHQDIIDQVIYALRDDRATLLRCCTVSHSFLNPSRKHLFFDTEISHFRNAKSLKSLIHVLSIHPEYLSYIRILRIWGLEVGAHKKPAFVRLIEGIADRRVLRVFSLEMNRSWEALSVPMQTALARLLRSPSLHTIVSRMCGHTFPVHVLGLATGLRHLDFIGDHSWSCRHTTDVSPMTLPLPSPASPNIYLESLQLTFETNEPALVGYLSRPDCPLKMSQLRQLWIHSNYRLPTAAATVMKDASRSLESFIWFLSVESFSACQSSGEDWFESSYLNFQGSSPSRTSQAHRSYETLCLSDTSLSKFMMTKAQSIGSNPVWEFPRSWRSSISFTNMTIFSPMMMIMKDSSSDNYSGTTHCLVRCIPLAGFHALSTSISCMRRILRQIWMIPWRCGCEVACRSSTEQVCLW